MPEIDWANVIAGFLLGLLPLILPIIYRLVLLYFSPQRRKYYGDFYLYHRSGTDPEIIRMKKLSFHSSIVGYIRATMTSDVITKLAYRGSVLKGAGGTLYIKLTGRGNSENVFIVCYDAISSKMMVTNGLLSTVDLNGNPCCWRCIISRNKIAQEQLPALLTAQKPHKFARISFSEVMRITDNDNGAGTES